MLVVVLISMLMSYTSVDFFVLPFVSPCSCVASEIQA